VFERARDRYREGNWRRAVALYEDNPAALDHRDLLRYADALANIRETVKARAIYEQVSAATDYDRRLQVRARAAQLFLGVAEGDLPSAERGLRDLVEEIPESYWAQLYLGRVLKAAGKRYEALAVLYEAVDRESRDFRAYFEIGEIYEALFLFDAAIDAYEDAIYYNPRYAQAINNLGYCYKEKSVLVPGLRLYAYAVKKYREAIAIQPDNAGFYYNIGNAYTHQGKLRKAFQAYKTAVDLEPGFAKAHFNLARTYQRFRKLDKAIEEFELYLRYGNPAVFDFVEQPEVVREEIEAMKETLKRRGRWENP